MGTDIKTTKTAENLQVRVSNAYAYHSSFRTHAAVAPNISTLEAVPSRMSPAAKITANPARQSRRFFVPCTCDNTVMAIVGSRHATIVEMEEVKRKMLVSEYLVNVSSAISLRVFFSLSLAAEF